MTLLSRQLWVVVHRWAGLTLAVFLVIAGATGAMLPFQQELTHATAAWDRVSPPYPGAPLLDPLSLNRAAMRAEPDAAIEGLRLNIQPDHALVLSLTAKPGRTLDYDMIAIDPYTAAVRYRGRWADPREGTDQLINFLYSLHYSFALGSWGTWAFGIAALVWTVDCFIGFYLTLPVARRRWWAKWRKGWVLRRPARGYRLNFDLHRAGGLWLWPALLVFAWSSVGMNLRGVYDPAMRAMGAESPYESVTPRPVPASFAPDWSAAYARGVALAKSEGTRLGYEVVQPSSLFLDREKGVYSYNFTSSRDVTDKGGWSGVLYRTDGALVRTIVADGGLDDGGADTWLMALHTAQVGGLAYRIFVSLLGLAVVSLSVTGVVIWMKKRSARLLGRRRNLPTVALFGADAIAAE